MKYFLLLTIFSFTSCTQTPEKSDSVSNKNGSIKTKTEWIYTKINPTEGKKNSIETYDKNGKIITREVYSADGIGEISERTTYKYNGDKVIEESVMDLENKLEHKNYTDYDNFGRVIRHRNHHEIGKGNIWDSTVNKYDSEGKINYLISYENGDSLFGVQFKYNNKNELIEQISNEVSPEKHLYTYKDGLLIEEKVSLFDTENTIKFVYDEKRNVIEEKTFGNNDNLNPMWVSKYVYEYYTD